MDLKDILAISGKSGLFKFISQGRNAIIVESLSDKKRTAVQASAKVNSLKDIAIFTETEDMPLGDVFKKMYETLDGKKTISHKSSSEDLKATFEECLPEYDKDRVYVSDIKKVIFWYNQLVDLSLIDLEEEKTEEKEGTEKKTKTSDKQVETPAPDSTDDVDKGNKEGKEGKENNAE